MVRAEVEPLPEASGSPSSAGLRSALDFAAVVTALLEPPPLIGDQEPRLLWTPPGRASSVGPHAVQWALDTLGIELDPWEQLALELILARRVDARWVAYEVALIVSRRNGKSLIFLVRMLYGLFVLHERRIVYSAHLGDSSQEMYGDVLDILEGAPELDHLIARTPATNGKEGVHLKDGCKLRFKTRTRTGGRGLDGDTLFVDEAQEFVDDQARALSPILGARSMKGNPQVLYGASAGTFVSTVLGRIRRRGIAGGDPRLLFIEHSVDDEAWRAADPDARMAMAEDPKQWAIANPALGIRISPEFLAGQLRLLGPIGFAQEHLGIGSYPVDDSTDWIIPRAKWLACADEESGPPVGVVVLAIGAAWDRTVSIAVCGARADGMVYAELTHYGSDSPAKIVAAVKRLRDRHRPAKIVIDDKGPAGPFVAPLEAAKIDLEKVTVREVAHACGGLFDAVTASEPNFRHRRQPEVSSALAGAKKKNLGDGWVLDRRLSSADVTPLEVLALARWGFVKFGADASSVYEERGLVVL